MFEFIVVMGIIGCALGISYSLGYSRALHELKPRVDAIEKLSREDRGPK